MADVILNAEDFLARFKVGDVFWHMKRYLGQVPSEIEGPCRIIALSTTYEGREVGTPIVTFTHQPKRISGNGEETKTMFVSDITEATHGAFVSEVAAYAYMRERQLIYIIDPNLAAELKKERLVIEGDGELIIRMVMAERRRT